VDSAFLGEMIDDNAFSTARPTRVLRRFFDGVLVAASLEGEGAALVGVEGLGFVSKISVSKTSVLVSNPRTVLQWKEQES